MLRVVGASSISVVLYTLVAGSGLRVPVTRQTVALLALESGVSVRCKHQRSLETIDVYVERGSLMRLSPDVADAWSLEIVAREHDTLRRPRITSRGLELVPIQVARRDCSFFMFSS